MMDTVRSWMSGITVALLAVGYAASQRAFLSGTLAEHAERLAQPAVATLGLTWMALAALAACSPDLEGDR